MTDSATPSTPVRFRGRSLMALVLRPEPPIDDWLIGLDDLLGRSPGYFTSRPVVADLSAMPGEGDQLLHLMDKLQGRNIRVMAIEGADPTVLGVDVARLPPVVTDGRPASAPALPPGGEPLPGASPDAAALAAALAAQPPRSVPSLIVDKPVRSGQSITFAEGDVTILGSVASGAEVMAGGSIHIYGTLRGRAMAGFAHKDGRIFCSKLHAELLAIDGIYKTADEMDAKLRGRAIQAWTSGDTLVIAGLD
ncbi:septum site-determining protein MinC [Lichenibacterium ramalinae]|uniref:Probable septum site-determining protein MinC n=1 Tax=Lichenibacterium ramalinae TaxID=2316527 RepID=A0A4Q2R9S3_9HYPH|nr:septum site-determining protein MinC [Lichenibacterium ramalinae]RYB02280.1 septum formation inhibitor MinC [Lichenibacterium ramalinae]